MIKYVCNKCGAELTKAEQKVLRLSTSRVIPRFMTFDIHLCNNCLIEFIGKEEMENIKEQYAEYLKARKERRKAREVQNG